MRGIVLALTLGVGAACGGGGGGSGPPAIEPDLDQGAGLAPGLEITAFSVAESEVDAGSLITVEDSILNDSDELAGLFAVRIYLSNDAVLDPADLLLGGRVSPGLAAQGAETVEGELRVPVETSAGTYRAVARLESISGAQTGEVRWAESVLAVTEPILADLVLEAIEFSPPSAVAGATIQVSDRVSNIGLGDSPAFEVVVHLSRDGVFSADDVLIGTRTVTVLLSGEDNATEGVLTLPATLAPGIWRVLAVADPGDDVPELGPGANIRFASSTLQVTVLPRPDLVPVECSFSAVTVDAGDEFEVQESVENRGLSETGTFQVGIVLSEDPLIDADDLLIGSRTVGSLAVGASDFATGNVRIPPHTAGGNWYVGVRVDFASEVPEISELNNSLLATGVLVVTIPPRPDFVLRSIAFQPTSARIGESVSFSEIVANEGVVSSAAFEVGIFLSTNATITVGDILLGTRPVPGLAVGAESAAGTEFTLPIGLSPGSYYVGAYADPSSDVPELDDGNNGLLALGTLDVIATPDPKPDLLVALVTFDTTFGSPGSVVQVVGNVRNEGELSSGPFQNGVFLSVDESISSDDRQIGSWDVGQLGIGFGSASSSPFVVPTDIPAGDYFVGVIADIGAAVEESDEGNNSKRANGLLHVTIPPPPAPDLVVVRIEPVETSLAAGDPLSIDFQARNDGNEPGTAVSVEFFLSLDDEFDEAQDVLLGTRSVSALVAGEGTTAVHVFDLPAGTAAGTYRLVARIDSGGELSESDEDNNVRVSTQSFDRQ